MSGTSHSDIVIPNNTDIAYMRIAFRQSFLDGISLFDKKVSIFKGKEAFSWHRAPEDFTIQIAKNSNSRLYEIDEETYNKLNVDPEFTGDKLVEKFPYRDDLTTNSTSLEMQINILKSELKNLKESLNNTPQVAK